MGWIDKTTVAQRLGEVMQLLCGGQRPADAVVKAWLNGTSEELQEFAIEHGPAWCQGIALIDAAMVMVDQPTEGVDHERREAEVRGTPTPAGEPVAWIRFQPPFKPDVYVQRHMPRLDGEPDQRYKPLVFDDTAPPVREPLTPDEALDAFCKTPGIRQHVQAFVAGVRFAERHHGITKGAPHAPI